MTLLGWYLIVSAILGMLAAFVIGYIDNSAGDGPMEVGLYVFILWPFLLIVGVGLFIGGIIMSPFMLAGHLGQRWNK